MSANNVHNQHTTINLKIQKRDMYTHKYKYVIIYPLKQNPFRLTQIYKLIYTKLYNLLIKYTIFCADNGNHSNR